MKIIFESQRYFDAIFEIQKRIRNKIKYEDLTDDEEKILQWISDLIVEEMEERGLKHYWSD